MYMTLYPILGTPETQNFRAYGACVPLQKPYFVYPWSKIVDIPLFYVPLAQIGVHVPLFYVPLSKIIDIPLLLCTPK